MMIGQKNGLAALLALLALAGCTLQRFDQPEFICDLKCEEVIEPGCGPSQLEIDQTCRTGCLADGMVIPPSPETVGRNEAVQYWDLTLDEAIMLALQQSPILRDLGGTILRNPEAVLAVHDPAIAFTDPRFGEEAALSAFDASLAASAFFEKNDRVFNNQFIGTAGLFDQDLHNYNVELRKRAATGTQMALRHITEYDSNNNAGNRFGNPSTSWGTYFESEVRQPLLQGSGLQFNRIAGPGNQPGVFNGILLARIRSDTSLAEFEANVRDLVSNVENAYWDLYFAYYDLQAKKEARDFSLSIWQTVKAKYGGGEGEAEGELASRAELDQAREQYWRFESDVRNAENGRLTEGTAANVGSGGGSFRNPTGGVRVAERRLRLIIGLPINSAQLIRPATPAPDSPIKFDWDACAADALALRPELRRQRWRVKQREMELTASRNFLSPRLDLVGRYRWRGFGKDLISQSNATFASAWGNLADGKNDEWQLGVEMDIPLGFRQAHAGVRNAELRLAREKAILGEQERNVLYGLSNSFGEVRRSFEVLQAQFNRVQAAENQVEDLRISFQKGDASIDVLLEAQRRLIEGRIAYNQAAVDYALSLKNVHYEKGTLLDFNNVVLAEGASDSCAYATATKRKAWDEMDYVLRSPTISAGPVQQQTLAPGDAPATSATTDAGL